MIRPETVKGMKKCAESTTQPKKYNPGFAALEFTYESEVIFFIMWTKTIKG